MQTSNSIFKKYPTLNPDQQLEILKEVSKVKDKIYSPFLSFFTISPEESLLFFKREYYCLMDSYIKTPKRERSKFLGKKAAFISLLKQYDSGSQAELFSLLNKIYRPEKAIQKLTEQRNYIAEGNENIVKETLETITEAEEASKKYYSLIDQMVKGNLGLITKISREYLGLGVHLNDLLQEGKLGLIKAVEGFDYNKGVKFSTYAGGVIRYSLMSYIDRKGDLIKLPDRVHKLKREIKMATKEHYGRYGRNPNSLELSELISEPISNIITCLKIKNKTLSLNANRYDSEESDYIGYLEDRNTEGLKRVSIEEKLIERQCDQKINDMIKLVVSELPEREQMIICYRFGLNKDKAKTLDQIGKIFSLTKERIRQLEKEILMKLKGKLKWRKEFKELISQFQP